MLSIVVIFHNMRREAARTLRSLVPPYQQGVDPQSYEVLAIDNGSSAPLDPAEVTALGPQITYHALETDSVSPVDAVNFGVSQAKGRYVAVIVDGARMASPGLIGATLSALPLKTQPFVVGLSWHLGPEVQNDSMLKGYGQTEEDQLLDSIKWPDDGYRLFEISTLAQSSNPGFFGRIPPECSWLAMRHDTFQRIGGFETRFQSPGGGLVNHDFRNRVLAEPDLGGVVLLGEGVFHQFHGGVATNVPRQEHPMAQFMEEYRRIRHAEFAVAPSPAVTYFGTLPEGARRFAGLN
ncbi:O-methyltransferase [Candidatus Rhodobacter oscarellae]|uniref:O-methyltransferase n=1 Tax=Candidatus Rhodobacter oscarellae TaxID=1675527 RepID=A0A0J9GYL8_9RHOB|nr:glycosyltransferase family A protein [Candidatus Rhodobacter lobularis]KMW58588.1 O-methyltransferase [Candidatus Rhodobacter lobularis]